MATETLGTPRSKTLFRQRLSEVITDSFINSSGSEIKAGTEITFDGSGNYVVRTASTDEPIGIVVAGNKDGKRVTVQLRTNIVFRASTTGAVSAGDSVLTTGAVDGNDLPKVGPTAAGDYRVGIALDTAGGANEEILVMWNVASV